jgi:hypothetical protein
MAERYVRRATEDTNITPANMTVKQLQQEASCRHLPGFSGMRKADLVQLVTDARRKQWRRASR